MADIAGIFHWPLSELRSLGIDELIHWRELAVAFFKRTRREER